MRPSVFFLAPVLLSLVVVRLLSAFYANISDCDETFNYWEPLHYLMHGSGFQTWEYSPTYAVRSYAYIGLHQLILWPFSGLGGVTQFYVLRIVLSLICAGSEFYFIRSMMHRVGLGFGLMLWGVLLTSCGMYISAAAFLPSSFAMYCTMLAYASLANQRYKAAIFFVAMGALIGWPFSAILGVPIAWHIVVHSGKPFFFVLWSLISFAAIAIPSVAVDYYYYGETLLAPLNIVLYNVFGKGGPDLYGTEKFSYYILNGILNFNLLFPFALLGTGLGLLKTLTSLYKHFASSRDMKPKEKDIFCSEVLMALFLWLAVFLTRPHKEERFLFPVYPLVCFAALFAMETGREWIVPLGKSRRTKRTLRDLLSASIFSTVFVHGILSLSRALALFYGYHAPLDLYSQLGSLPPTIKERLANPHHINLCLGKEWYRFPSSFFLPNSEWHLRFIKSDFRAQLPKPFEAPPPIGTRAVPRGFNDMNREEVSRYLDVEECDLLFELDVPRVTHREPRYATKLQAWETVLKELFVDASRSHGFFRAFFFPYASWQTCAPVDYVLLLNKARTKPKPIPG